MILTLLLSGNALLYCGLALSVRNAFTGRPPAHLVHAVTAMGAWLLVLACALAGEPIVVGLTGVVAVWETWEWWRKRPKGRRRKALVDQMTPSPIPVPGGAR